MLIKHGRIIDPKSGLDAILDIRIENNNIIQMEKDILVNEGEKVIDANGCIVAPGFVDIHVHFREPGMTYKEDIMSGSIAAAKGGFTSVICMANTNPIIDQIEILKDVIAKGKETKINVYSIAAITKGFDGEELTDLEALKSAGAVGFSDDGIPIRNAGLVEKAMLEAKRLDVPLSFHEEDPTFIVNNGINRGNISEALGIGGSSVLAEDVMIARDVMIALHTKAQVDIQHISSKNAVTLVRLAKSLGANIHAEATPHHFSLNEQAVLTYGTLAKMNPPLRKEEDRLAIIEGLKDGTIDIIATDHAPHSDEEKQRELTAAPSGIIGLETALSLGLEYLVKEKHLTLSELLAKMTFQPAELYHLDKGYLAVGGPADLVIFQEEAIWSTARFASKSNNSPFLDREMLGEVKYTICHGEVVYEKNEL